MQANGKPMMGAANSTVQTKTIVAKTTSNFDTDELQHQLQVEEAANAWGTNVAIGYEIDALEARSLSASRLQNGADCLSSQQARPT